MYDFKLSIATLISVAFAFVAGLMIGDIYNEQGFVITVAEGPPCPAGESCQAVINNAESVLKAGTAVRVNGSIEKIPTVLPASAKSATTPEILGVTLEDIEPNEFGLVVKTNE